jgi:uncharacterized protein YjbJ (UPF0337 family)
MNKDRVKGTVDETVGSAKRKAGELTNDMKLRVEGMAQQVKGKVENAWAGRKMRSRRPMRKPEHNTIPMCGSNPGREYSYSLRRQRPVGA